MSYEPLLQRLLLLISILPIVGCGGAYAYQASPRPPALDPRTLLDETGTLATDDRRVAGNAFEDRFEVPVNSGARLTIEVTATEFDPVLDVAAPGMGALNNDDWEGDQAHSRINLVAAQSGVLKIRVSSYGARATGAYRVLVYVDPQVSYSGPPSAGTARPATPAGPEGHAAQFIRGQSAQDPAGLTAAVPVAPFGQSHALPSPLPTLPTTVQLSRTAMGTLAAGDMSLSGAELADVYAFDATAGARLRVDLASTTFDTYLVVVSPDGTRHENDDRATTESDSAISFEASMAGRYLLYATSEGANQTGLYTLTVTQPTTTVLIAPPPVDAEVSTPASRFARASGRTCVVLSVGSFKGFAHAGALRALRARGVRVDCIVGNSMGALVAALYATAPTEDPGARIRAWLAAYVRATEQQAASDAAAGAFIGALLTGGLGGALLGGAVGGVSVNRIDHVRAIRVLRATVHDVDIESAQLPFATFYDRRTSDGLETVDAASGNLADAVGRSIANPFIFSDIDLRRDSTTGIDPGADRPSATPVEDACRLFPDARIIAINVTNRPAFYSGAMQCPVLEVRVPVDENIDPNGIARGGPAFDQLLQVGESATLRALTDAGL